MQQRMIILCTSKPATVLERKARNWGPRGALIEGRHDSDDAA